MNVSREVLSFYDARQDLIRTAAPRVGLILAADFGRPELSAIGGDEIAFSDIGSPINTEPVNLTQTLGLIVHHASEQYTYDTGAARRPFWDKRTAPEVATEILCNYSGFSIDLLDRPTTQNAAALAAKTEGQGDETLRHLRPAVVALSILQELHFDESHKFFKYLRSPGSTRTRNMPGCNTI